jgi:hypothetical protein
MRLRVAPQLAKKPARLVTVALANKLARILWAMMKTGKPIRHQATAVGAEDHLSAH